jgi:phage replication-related protein YjqB (UPF0714/DUF867 family)
MSYRDIAIKKTLPSQTELRDHREHCSIDPETLAAIGCTLEQQVRIKRRNDEYALYTVSEVNQGNPGKVIRMGLSGRQRLGTGDEFNGEVDPQVPNLTLSEDTAEANGEFIERIADNGSQNKLIAIAPHGGNIEAYTDQQAEHLATRLGVSSWCCKGWKRGGDAHDRWHITSVDINSDSFPLLNSVMRRGFTYAVAFHGLNDPNQPGILIGGTAPTTLKEDIKAAIAGAVESGIEVRVARPDDVFGGDDPRNIVNRLTAWWTNGIQIEQSPQARSRHWITIADAVADVYAANCDYL